MKYKYDLVFEDKNLNIKHTLECGQCFRWKCIYDEGLYKTYEYVGVIEDRVIKIRQEKNNFFVSSSNINNLKQMVYEYFDLNYDYEKTESIINKIDNNIQMSLKLSSGLHILNQPVFETIISYIISANNNIKRISRSVEEISKMFGKEIEFENNKYYLFPTIKELENINEEKLFKCGVGFRARYIIKTVTILSEKNNNIIKEYTNMQNEEIKQELLTYMGIGNKVADCIMLFSMKRRDIFPIDVWIKRVMDKLYFKKDTSIEEIKKYAKKQFGGNAGLIQQHLFYNIRKSNI